MFTALLLNNSQDREATSMSINRWMDKEDEVHVCNEMWLSQKNEILLFAATWMDLEIIILSEISQTQNDNYMMSLLCGIYKKNTY